MTSSNSPADELQQINTFVGLRAGIFLTGTPPLDLDAKAVATYKQNIVAVDASHLPFDLVIVANWTHHPSHNLPQSSPDTLTNVLGFYRAHPSGPSPNGKHR